MSDCSRNLSEQSLFVELFRRKEGCTDGVTQAIQTAKERMEEIRSRKTGEIILLNPATLKDYNIRS